MSLEHLLKISNDLEMLKEFKLTEEEIKKFNELSPMTFEKQLAQFESYIKLQAGLLSSDTLNNNRLGTRYISEENQMGFTLDYLNKNFTVIDDVVSIPTNDTTIANEFKQFIKSIGQLTGSLTL